jgi:hypothetical protein
VAPDGTVAADGSLADDAALAGMPTKERIQRALQGRFFLRVHMFVILGCTIGAGLLSTRLLHALHFTNMPWRYGIAVAAAYAVFLGLVRLWLLYVGYCIGPRSGGDLDWIGGIDFSGSGCSFGSSSVDASGSDSSELLETGGGRFGGGGASGGWGPPLPAASGSSTIARAPALVSSTSRAPSSSAPSSSSSSTSSSSSVKSGGGKGGGLDLDIDEDFFLILLVVLLALAIAAAAVWLIWAAPVILSEAAFQAALAAALARKTKKIAHDAGWVGSVMKATILPFLAVLVCAVVLGWYAHHHCPSATRLADAFQCAAF